MNSTVSSPHDSTGSYGSLFGSLFPEPGDGPTAPPRRGHGRGPSARPPGRPAGFARRAGRPLPAPAPHASNPAHARHVMTMLLEWFAELGLPTSQRLAIEFMRAHASVVVVMPDLATIERLALERQIVRSLDADDARPRTVDRLATLHGKSKRFIAKTYKRVDAGGIASRRARSVPDLPDRPALPCRVWPVRYRLRCRV